MEYAIAYKIFGPHAVVFSFLMEFGFWVKVRMDLL
jgi:hypothetical protein